MVFCFQNCSELQWEKKMFSDRKKLKAENLQTFEITIYPSSEKSVQFLKQNVFLICFWRLFRSNKVCTKKKVDWAKFLNRHSSKSIWVIKLSFCQNDSLIGGSFWQKDSFITHILELCQFSNLAQSTFFGTHFMSDFMVSFNYWTL